MSVRQKNLNINDYITIVRIYVLRQIDNISGYCADLAYIYGKLTIFLDIVPIFRQIFLDIVPIFRHIFSNIVPIFRHIFLNICQFL